jgi:hypothetical protein
VSVCFFSVTCMNDVWVCVLSGASGEMVGSDLGCWN